MWNAVNSKIDKQREKTMYITSALLQESAQIFCYSSFSQFTADVVWVFFCFVCLLDWSRKMDHQIETGEEENKTTFLALSLAIR